MPLVLVSGKPPALGPSARILALVSQAWHGALLIVN